VRVYQVILIDTLELELAAGVHFLFELNIQVRRRTARRFVTFACALETGAYFHSSSHKYLMVASLLPDSASIEAYDLTFVSHGLSSTAVKVFETACKRHVDVCHGLGKNLVESAEGSSEI